MCTIVLGLLPSPLSEHRRGQCPLNHEILDLRVHPSSKSDVILKSEGFLLFLPQKLAILKQFTIKLGDLLIISIKKTVNITALDG